MTKNQERARELALKTYWAATVGPVDASDPPCPSVDEWDSLEPEDIAALERTVPIITALLDAVEREAKFKLDQEIWRNCPEAVEPLVRERDAALSQVAALREALVACVAPAPHSVNCARCHAGLCFEYDSLMERAAKLTDAALSDTESAARAHDERIAREAREDEREQCALVCEKLRGAGKFPAAGALDCAAAIRARKEAGENDAASGQEHREPASGADSLPTPTAPQAATPAPLLVTEADLLRLAEMAANAAMGSILEYSKGLRDDESSKDVAARVLREWREGR